MIALKIGKIKPSRLVEIAFAPFTEQFAAKNVQLEFQIPYTLPELSCDVGKIAWVLTNFFSNALRYTPAWGRLTVRGIMTAEKMRISVENAGYGVPLERLQRMFEMGDNYEAPEFGQGLALALAREIVEAHGGTIAAESEIGVMTRFYIDLPVTKIAENII